ncbi:thioredoxin family protein [Variovorax sp. OV329]|uniref:thioredoxin family protein n=1 Tax=Variovorax sp. OV329 TaxID=1882825 RepID=UPI0008F2FEFD|nr:thioredoxin family protein [Variovorax sp. OV329]SFN27470.1 thioredoxin 1 [Variovorax sp. OV329]
MTAEYANEDLTRAQVDADKGTTVLEFGATWCPICQGAQPLIDQALQGRPWKHLQIDDGPGRPLGRSFQVKLWPTLVFLHDGKVLARVVRPQTAQDLADALAKTEESAAG